MILLNTSHPFNVIGEGIFLVFMVLNCLLKKVSFTDLREKADFIEKIGLFICVGSIIACMLAFESDMRAASDDKDNKERYSGLGACRTIIFFKVLAAAYKITIKGPLVLAGIDERKHGSLP